MSTAPTPPSVVYPFDRRFWAPDQNATSGDLNLAAQHVEDTLIQLLLAGTAGRIGQLVGNSPNSAILSGGFWRGGLMPRASGAFGVTINGGFGFVVPGTNHLTFEGNYNLNDMQAWKPIVLPYGVTLVCPNAHATLPRIDLIEVRSALATTDAEDVSTLDENTGVVSTTSKNRTLTRRITSSSTGYVLSPASSTAPLSYKQGVANGSPTAPASTSGYEPVAYVYVPASAAAITAANIYDLRRVVGSNRVSLLIEKSSGTGGALSVLALDAPPGVQVAVWNDVAGAKAGYQIYILSGNAQRVYDAGVTAIPVQISSSYSSFSPTETTHAYAAASVATRTGTDVTRLAAAVPSAVVAGSDIALAYFAIVVRHLRNNAVTVDSNLSYAQLDSITFDIPVV